MTTEYEIRNKYLLKGKRTVALALFGSFLGLVSGAYITLKDTSPTPVVDEYFEVKRDLGNLRGRKSFLENLADSENIEETTTIGEAIEKYDPLIFKKEGEFMEIRDSEDVVKYLETQTFSYELKAVGTMFGCGFLGIAPFVFPIYRLDKREEKELAELRKSKESEGGPT